MLKKTSLALAIMASMSACTEAPQDGQSSQNQDTSPTTASAVKTGRMQSIQTAGLRYTSGDIEGVTDSLGRYKFRENAPITFFLGNVKLGTANGKSTINAADILNKSSLNDEQVSNLITLLRSLDADGNPKNGITISPEMQTLAEIFTGIDFSSPNFKAELEVLLSTIGKILNPDSPQYVLETLACRYSGLFQGSIKNHLIAGSYTPILVKSKNKKFFASIRLNGIAGALYNKIEVDGPLIINTENGTAKLHLEKYFSALGMIPISINSSAHYMGFNRFKGILEEEKKPSPIIPFPSKEQTKPELSATRVGGIFDGIQRVIGSPENDTYAGFSIDVDSSGFISGADTENNTLSGKKTGNTITFTSSNNVSFSGSIDSEGKLTGTTTKADGTTTSYVGHSCNLI